MDEFFTKYGWLVVAGIIIVIVLQYAPTYGAEITGNISAFVDSLCTYVETAITSLPAPQI